MSTNVIRDETRWIKPTEQHLPDFIREVVAGRRWSTARRKRRTARQLRLDLRDVSMRIATSGRVRICGSDVKWTETGANFKVDRDADGSGHAGVEGVLGCDRPHQCPVCSARIGLEKGKELSELATAWLETGGLLAFMTLTLARIVGEPITDATAVLKQVRTRFNRLAKPFLVEAVNLGYIESMEWTIDRLWNGSGHPHLMRLFFFRNPEMLGEFQRVLGQLWSQAAAENGRYADPIYGCHVAYPELSAEGDLRALGAYMTKTGSSVEHELMSHGSKTSRSDGTCTPFELLEEIERSGDFTMSNPMVQTWQLYVKATYKVPVAIYSPLLKRALKEVAARRGQMDFDALAAAEPEAEQEEAAVDEALADERKSSKVPGETVVTAGRQAIRFIHRMRIWGTVFNLLEDLAEWGWANDVEPNYVAAMRALFEGLGAPEEALAEIWREGEVS